MTTLDTTSALVVVDLQQGIVGMPLAHPVGAVVDNSARLAKAFRAAGRPVVLVNATGTAPGRTDAAPRVTDFPAGFADLVDELDAQPGDHRVSKQTWGAFTDTDLDDYLRDQGVTQVVVVGIATSAGVESTARFAHELGYHVLLVRDAMTDRTLAVHEHSVGHVFPRLGEVATTGDVLGLL